MLSGACNRETVYSSSGPLYLSTILGFPELGVVLPSSHKSTGHTNMICYYQVEVKQYASLTSQNIKQYAT